MCIQRSRCGSGQNLFDIGQFPVRGIRRHRESPHPGPLPQGEGEIHDLMWRWDKRFGDADAELLKALEITDAQESRTFGLRAAMSYLKLARERDDPPRGRSDRQRREAVAGGLQLVCRGAGLL